MGITFIYDVTGSIDKLQIIDHESVDGPSLSFVYLKDMLKCSNIIINQTNASIFLMKVLNLWKAKVTIDGFWLENASISIIFEIVLDSWLNITDLSIFSLFCSGPKDGALMLVDSYSELSIYNVVIADIHSNNPLISIFDSLVKLSSAEFSRIWISGNDSLELFVFTLDSSSFVMNDVIVNYYYRSVLHGQAGSLMVNNFSTSNQGAYYGYDGYYSYSSFELERMIEVSLNNTIFTNSSFANMGGVNFFLKKLNFFFFLWQRQYCLIHVW